jgi:hypothetical protein
MKKTLHEMAPELISDISGVGECRIKELETLHLKPDKTVTEWKVGEKSYFVFNNSGLYFDVYENIKQYGAPEICSDYNA